MAHINCIFVFGHTPLASVTPVMAADTAIDNAVAEIAAVYQYLDENDKAAIRTARDNLQNLLNLTERWNGVVSPLLTQIRCRIIWIRGHSRKTEIINFVSGLGDIYYSSDGWFS
jgi:hypothetical protein